MQLEPHPLTSRLSELRTALDQHAQLSRVKDAGMRTGAMTPYTPESSSVVLSKREIRGRSCANDGCGHFVGYLDLESGRLRLDHTGDAAFWIELDLPLSVLRCPYDAAAELPAATAMIRAQERITEAEARVRELSHALRKEAQAGLAVLYDGVRAGDVVIPPSSISISGGTFPDMIVGAHLDVAAGGVLRVYAHVFKRAPLYEVTHEQQLRTYALPHMVHEVFSDTPVLRLLRDAHVAAASAQGLSRAELARVDEAPEDAVQPGLRVKFEIFNFINKLLVEVDLEALVAEYMSVKFRPNSAATDALFGP